MLEVGDTETRKRLARLEEDIDHVFDYLSGKLEGLKA